MFTHSACHPGGLRVALSCARPESVRVESAVSTKNGRMRLKLPTLPSLPETPPKFWPKFESPLHSPAVTARVGRVLGIFIGICFITGLLSHYQYAPWSWLPEPAHPSWGYRFTQGLHVITGITSIPLLLVKLWSVYPRLFAWPPAKGLLDALERGSIAILVSATLLELATGFMNILRWYAVPWGFVYVHYSLAYIIAGSLLLHIAVKLPIIRQGLATPLNKAEAPEIAAAPRDLAPRAAHRDRRRGRRDHAHHGRADVQPARIDRDPRTAPPEPGSAAGAGEPHGGRCPGHQDRVARHLSAGGDRAEVVPADPRRARGADGR